MLRGDACTRKEQPMALLRPVAGPTPDATDTNAMMNAVQTALRA